MCHIIILFSLSDLEEISTFFVTDFFGAAFAVAVFLTVVFVAGVFFDEQDSNPEEGNERI